MPSFQQEQYNQLKSKLSNIKRIFIQVLAKHANHYIVKLYRKFEVKFLLFDGFENRFSVKWKDPVQSELESLYKALHLEPTKRLPTREISSGMKSDIPSECERKIVKKKRRATMSRWQPKIYVNKKIHFDSMYSNETCHLSKSTGDNQLNKRRFDESSGDERKIKRNKNNLDYVLMKYELKI